MPKAKNQKFSQVSENDSIIGIDIDMIRFLIPCFANK